MSAYSHGYKLLAGSFDTGDQNNELTSTRFCLMFNCWGIALSWGTFQTYYTSGGISDVKDSSSIAWIGSIQAFLLTGGFALGGKYFDAGYFRPIMWSGSFFVVFGLMMTSLSTKYYQVMLAQGVCVGIGLSLVFVPGVGLPR